MDAEEIEMTEADAEAKLNKDGSVRRKPGPKPGGVRRAAAPGKAPASRAKKSDGAVDYRPAIIGLAQIPQMVLGLGARFLKRPQLALDGLTIGVHAPALASALNETAQTETRLQALLDRLMVVGPYGLVIAAAAPLVAQILVNHGVAEPNPELGTLGPEDLMSRATAHLAAA